MTGESYENAPSAVLVMVERVTTRFEIPIPVGILQSKNVAVTQDEVLQCSRLCGPCNALECERLAGPKFRPANVIDAPPLVGPFDDGPLRLVSIGGSKVSRPKVVPTELVIVTAHHCVPTAGSVPYALIEVTVFHDTVPRAEMPSWTDGDKSEAPKLRPFRVMLALNEDAMFIGTDRVRHGESKVSNTNDVPTTFASEICAGTSRPAPDTRFAQMTAVLEFQLVERHSVEPILTVSDRSYAPKFKPNIESR
jgi:hypothetical protein